MFMLPVAHWMLNFHPAIRQPSAVRLTAVGDSDQFADRGQLRGQLVLGHLVDFGDDDDQRRCGRDGQSREQGSIADIW